MIEKSGSKTRAERDDDLRKFQLSVKNAYLLDGVTDRLSQTMMTFDSVRREHKTRQSLKYKKHKKLI